MPPTSSQLGEALTAGQVGQLVQKRISPDVVEQFRRFSQFVTVVPTIPWDSTTYNWNNRLSLPPGGAVADGGARPLGNSVWQQQNTTLTHLQSVGSVTGYAQAVTRNLIGDLFRKEYDAASRGLTFDLETMLGWGSWGATQFGPWAQFDGLSQQVNQYASTSTVAQNAIDFGGNPLTTGMLDQLMDLVQSNSGMDVSSDYMFVMTPTALARIEQQQLALRRYVDKVEVDAGIKVSTYKEVPIVKSSFLGNTYASPMGLVTTTTGTTNGTLAAGTYYYTVVPIMGRAGLGAPAATVSAVTTGTTGWAAVNFAQPIGPQNSIPLLYEVYRGTTAANGTLLGLCDGVVTLQADGITPNYTTGIVDNGSTLIPTANAGALMPNPGQYPLSYVGGGAQTVRLPKGEDIYLIPRDPDYLVRPVVRDLQMLNVAATVSQPDGMPFALQSDTCLAVRGPQFMGRGRNSIATLSN